MCARRLAQVKQSERARAVGKLAAAENPVIYRLFITLARWMVFCVLVRLLTVLDGSECVPVNVPMVNVPVKRRWALLGEHCSEIASHTPVDDRLAISVAV